MESRILRHFVAAALVVGGTTSLWVTTAEATRPGPGRGRRPASAFNLFAGSVNFEMRANRVQCNVNNIGETCVDPTDSPVLGGGFWPAGSPDQYIFNGGLQLAGTIPSTAGFAWAGDTVGAAFFDARGRTHGEGLTNVLASTVVEDLAAWPSAAVIRDTALFDASLIGRRTISQQDVYVRYWDGNPNRLVGRSHPAGILVEERGLAWNFPTGNQDIIYFIYRFINISARNRAAYDGLSVAGYTTADIDSIALIGADFQARNEAAFGIPIPDDGYPITNMFASFSQDPDLGPNAGSNYSTGILPFSIGLVYKSDFDEPSFAFPPSIFGPPFAAAPGFEGVKYLKSPKDPADPLGQRELGITIFSNTTNGPPFPDPVGVSQLYRYLSGSLTPADGVCAVPNPQVRHVCAAVQTPTDTRFFESSGPFTLAPGGYAVIVVAYVFAAPVSAPIQAFIGGDMKPGIPLTGDLYVTPSSPADTVRNIERAAGWVSYSDIDGNGRIEQNEVVTVQRSLLQKALVAQQLFDTKFLLPFAPEAPLFFTVPGDGEVTVAWQTSPTEDVLTGGDPYFAVASNPGAGYDANYREFDVEGYRVWRGRTTGSMEVIAQFDYAGTTFTDYTGNIFSADYGSACAPEVGIQTTCPVDFLAGETFDHPVAGEIIQVRPGGYTPLANGNVLITDADTAVVGGASGLAALTDNLVPFVYVDATARNGFRYYYSVTAFDVNSVASGPTSLESPLVTKAVTPRAASTTVSNAVFVTEFLLGDGTVADPTAPFPTIDAANGTFSGIIPPANGASFGFLAAVAEALPVGDYILRIDSVSSGFTGGFGPPDPALHVSLITPNDTVQTSVSFVPPGLAGRADRDGAFFITGPLVPYDSARARQFGIAFTQDARMPVKLDDVSIPIAAMAGGVAVERGRFGTSGISAEARYLSHSYWFDEGGAQPADPTRNPFADAQHHAGQLTGVTAIYSPNAYRQPVQGQPTPASLTVRDRFRNFSYAQSSWYPADFVVTWGAGGTVVVRDSTHRVNLPFMAGMGTGYGFVNASAYVAASVTGANMTSMDGGAVTGVTNDPTVVGYRHFWYLAPVCESRGACPGNIDLASSAQLQPVDINNDGLSDGTGIALVINQEPFIMTMAALPAAGTKWHLKAVGGAGLTATCTPAVTEPLLVAPTDCSGYAFTPGNDTRPAFAPGLSFRIRVTRGFELASASGDLSRIHTVPDPYYVTNQLEITSNTKVLRFVNLPDRAIIRIYSVSGILVTILNHNDQTGGGEENWNLRNRNNQFVASGVYFYHVETPDGQEKIGRFTVVNFAQ